MISLPMRLQAALVLFLLGASAGSCDESTGLALRLEVRADLGGTITVSRLAEGGEPGAVESAAPGVTWTRRARIECSSGAFTALDGLAVGDVTFEHRSAGGTSRLSVVFPRGPEARWPSLLTLPDATERRRATRLVDPDDQLGDPGGRIALRLQLPAPVRAQGVRPEGGGLEVKIDGARADLIVPVRLAAFEGEPIVWTIAWDD